MSQLNTNRIEGETERQYVWRMGEAVDSGELSGWQEAAAIINAEWRDNEEEYRDESAYRKPYQYAKAYYEDVFAHKQGNQYVEELKTQKQELLKERIKLQTEKLEYNKLLRETARDELICEHICDAVAALEPLSIPEMIDVPQNSKSAILAFGDEHYGTEFTIYGLHGEIINSYSPEIFEQRMWELLAQVRQLIYKEHIGTLNVFAMGDFTDGVLRVGQLAKLKYGVVEGSVRYADYISSWLNELSKYVKIKYQMVFGNHSELRMLGQPKGTFAEENTGLFVREIIRTRLADNPNFEMIENPTGLIYDSIEGFNTLGIHGEVRNMEQALKDFTLAYNTPVHILIGGHMHHYKAETVGVEHEVVNVPSIIGIDQFAMDIKRTSRPGALMLTVERDCGITTINKIYL